VMLIISCAETFLKNRRIMRKKKSGKNVILLF
jgi:hypothetical protein